MTRWSGRAATGMAILALTIGGCGDSGSDANSSAAAKLPDGPVTLVALGDSLTAGDGDDSGLGYVGRLTEAIGATAGRAESVAVNLGMSGWDSTMLVDGGNGSPAELTTAVAEVQAAVGDGRAVLATVLIGSNDLWYLYQNGPPEGTPPETEDAAEDTYRRNLDHTVNELHEAGAIVVIGLPDDQSVRPGVADIDQLHQYLPDVTVEEVEQMAAMAGRLDQVAEEVAAEHDVLTVDTNAPFWADEAKMADDGIHPNGDGYADLTALWMAVIQRLL